MLQPVAGSSDVDGLCGPLTLAADIQAAEQIRVQELLRFDNLILKNRVAF
jgi:hypothetical protein